MNNLKLYNTLGKKLENFNPINSENIRIYACGPTVYDSIHIGNARPLVVFDILVRLLKTIYPKVTYVRNITCLLYTSPSPRDRNVSRMPSSA